MLLAYHVLNQWVGRLPQFEKPAEYAAFEKIHQEAYERTGIRIEAYCLMPNTGVCCYVPRADGKLLEVMI